jgi:hypothetical protein
LNGTNYTKSLFAFLPEESTIDISSLSKMFIFEKSAFPTPTIMIDIGRWDDAITASIVAYIFILYNNHTFIS